MADITMCSGVGCDKAVLCYRHTAPKEIYQSFFSDPPIDVEGKCEYFWNNNEYKKQNKDGKKEKVQDMDKS